MRWMILCILIFSFSLMYLVNSQGNNNIIVKQSAGNIQNERKTSIPLAEWQKEFIADLQAHHSPLKNSVPISDKDIESINIFLLNVPIAAQVPLDAESVRRDVLAIENNPDLSNHGNKHSYAYYQLPKESYQEAIRLINSIQVVPFDGENFEQKYHSRTYRDYRLLIEIQYANQAKVQIMTPKLSLGNILLARIIKNRQSYYFVMDNKDMDILMHYIDPDLITWAWVRRHF